MLNETFVVSEHQLPHPDHKEAVTPATAEDLHRAISHALLTHGEARGDGMFLEVEITGQHVVFNNYATAAAHSNHLIDKDDKNQVQSLKSGEALITAEVHNSQDQTIQSYLICKPSDIRRGSLVSSIIGQEFLDSLDQNECTVLSTSPAEEVRLTPRRLQEIIAHIM